MQSDECNLLTWRTPHNLTEAISMKKNSLLKNVNIEKGPRVEHWVLGKCNVVNTGVKIG